MYVSIAITESIANELANKSCRQGTWYSLAGVWQYTLRLYYYL